MILWSMLDLGPGRAPNRRWRTMTSSGEPPSEAPQTIDHLMQEVAAWEDASVSRRGRGRPFDFKPPSGGEDSRPTISDPDKCAHNSGTPGLLQGRNKGFDHDAAFRGLSQMQKSSKRTVPPPRIQEIITEEELSAAEEHRQRGNLHFKEGRFDLAKQCYCECIRKNPSAYLGYANRAMADLKLGLAEPAELDCTRAIELCPTYVKAWSRRGSARRELGKFAEAAADFEHALRLEPNNKSAARERAECIMLYWQGTALDEAADGKFRDIKITSDKGMERHLFPEALSRRAKVSPDQGTPSGSLDPPRRTRDVAPSWGAALDSAQAIARKKLIDRLGNGSFQSFADFESAWRSTQGDVQMEHAVLSALCSVPFELFFKDKMTPQLLYSILISALQLDSDRELVTLLEGVSQTRRFSMNILFLNTQQKDTLCGAWHQRALGCSLDIRPRLDSLKGSYCIS